MHVYSRGEDVRKNTPYRVPKASVHGPVFGLLECLSNSVCCLDSIRLNRLH